MEGINGANDGGGADNLANIPRCAAVVTAKVTGRCLLASVGGGGGGAVLSGEHASHLWETCLSPVRPRIIAS